MSASGWPQLQQLAFAWAGKLPLPRPLHCGPNTLTVPPGTGAGTALYEKDAETSLRDIEATLLVCAQQCALDDEDEVGWPTRAVVQALVLPVLCAIMLIKRVARALLTVITALPAPFAADIQQHELVCDRPPPLP